MSQTDADAGLTVLSLTGDLDVASVSTLRAAGIAALAQPDRSTLVLDVTALGLIDSTGIGTLVQLHNHAEEQDQRMALRGLSHHLSRVLTIAGLASVFNVDPPLR